MRSVVASALMVEVLRASGDLPREHPIIVTANFLGKLRPPWWAWTAHLGVAIRAREHRLA